MLYVRQGSNWLEEVIGHLWNDYITMVEKKKSMGVEEGNKTAEGYTQFIEVSRWTSSGSAGTVAGGWSSPT
jgi:hypothetical protein